VSLYTSSSNRKLYKTLILSGVVFGLYSFAVFQVNPKVTEFQNQWIENYATAEGFIYQKQPIQTVVVGSSMTARLNEVELGQGVYNLSFNGGSALTGLRIIKESMFIPETILVETNILERAVNKDMLNSLFTPIVWRIKRYLISLQYTYQPINIILSFIKTRSMAESVVISDKPINKKQLEFGIKRHRENGNNVGLFGVEDLFEQQEMIDYFSKSGVKILFFQMPVHKKVLSSKKYKKRKIIMQQMFPETTSYWINEQHQFETIDGIHLTLNSAYKFSKLLKDRIK